MNFWHDIFHDFDIVPYMHNYAIGFFVAIIGINCLALNLWLVLLLLCLKYGFIVCVNVWNFLAHLVNISLTCVWYGEFCCLMDKE